MRTDALAVVGVLSSLILAGGAFLTPACEQKPAATASDTDRPPTAQEQAPDASILGSPEPARPPITESQTGGDEPPLGLPPPTEPPGEHGKPRLPPPEKTIPEKMPPGELSH